MHNVTVIGANSDEESSPAEASFVRMDEQTDAILGLRIDDNQEVTNVGETKWFYVHYDVLGPDSCLVVDYDDGVMEAFGDREFCREWQPRIKFIDNMDISSPVVITHEYQ